MKKWRAGHQEALFFRNAAIIYIAVHKKSLCESGG
jgi:hypothetical protein